MHLNSSLLVVIFVSVAYVIAISEKRSEFSLNVEQLIVNHGYPLQKHTITTHDGYILKAHRIPYGKFNEEKINRPPVLVMPGLLCSSADWIVGGPNKALGFILADAGYDVWLVNPRGTTWSRKHIRLDPDKDAEFWDFSLHEIGVSDTPAFIDYILKETGQKDLFYIGHSQGGTVAFIMGSERPEYNTKIRLMMVMAPGSFLRNSKFILIPPFRIYKQEIKSVFKRHHIYELLPNSIVVATIFQTFCHPNFEYHVFCYMLFLALSGYSPDQLDKQRLPAIMNNFPAGGSVRQMFHFLQLSEADTLEKYDYGSAKNFVMYGQPTVPSYNLSAVTAPSAFYYSDQDAIVDELDTIRTITMLPNVVAKVFMKGFAHADYLWGIGAPNLLYSDVLNLMSRF